MSQLSKFIRSRDDWRSKAVRRADEIREHRKTYKRNQEKIAEIKRPINALKQAAEDNKKTLAPTAGQVVEITQAQEVRTLCVLLVIQAVVSYRSIGC